VDISGKLTAVGSVLTRSNINLACDCVFKGHELTNLVVSFINQLHPPTTDLSPTTAYLGSSGNVPRKYVQHGLYMAPLYLGGRGKSLSTSHTRLRA
jgi:hypothetical protein